ncbi:MAG: hypothetical protein AAGG38_05595 [Planctomycetota bacterium]
MQSETPPPSEPGGPPPASDRDPKPSAPGPGPTADGGFDAWVRSNPWHPRVAPFFCWIVFMTVTALLPEDLAPAQPLVYAAQCVATLWLLWKYRKLTPELTISFHWLAVPTGVGLLVAWVVLGYAMAGELGWRWEQALSGAWAAACGPFPYTELGREPGRFGPTLNAAGAVEPHPIQELTATHPALGWASMGLRLIGMSLIVPLFEELFIRSAMLRGLHRWKPTRTGLLQFASDLPLLGDWVSNTPAGRAAIDQPGAWTRQLETTPVGHLTLFAVIASTLVFCASHSPRDWPGCIACGLVWCGLVWWTNRPRPGRGETWASREQSTGGRGRMGLGPVVWSHGITNALLWAYTLGFGDWGFL